MGEREREFLTTLVNLEDSGALLRQRRYIHHADRAEDRVRQGLRRRGLIECRQQPKRHWAITEAGRAALAEAG